MFEDDLRDAAYMIYTSTRIPLLFVEESSGNTWTFTSPYSNQIHIVHLPPLILQRLLSIRLLRPVHLVHINHQNDKLVILPWQHSTQTGLILLWPGFDKFICEVDPDWQLPAYPLDDMDTNQLLNAALLLHCLLYQEQLSISQIMQDHQLLFNTPIHSTLDNQLISQRENSLYHKSYLLEKRIFESIRLGHKEQMLFYLKQHAIHEGKYGDLSKNDSLRSKKNLLITAITLATRAAVEGGLYSEEAYTLSDAYIMHIEELQQIGSIFIWMEDILIDFVQRVEKTQRMDVSHDIQLCQDYIFNHLYDNLSLEVLADQVNLHPAYLSRKFKEETGETLKLFIQRLRIEESKNLIVFSDYELSEIYALLNFHDQSYFTKVFKKYTGLTPKQYKNGLVVKQQK